MKFNTGWFQIYIAGGQPLRKLKLISFATLQQLLFDPHRMFEIGELVVSYLNVLTPKFPSTVFFPVHS
jgi:hypothetical protein